MAQSWLVLGLVMVQVVAGFRTGHGASCGWGKSWSWRSYGWMLNLVLDLVVAQPTSEFWSVWGLRIKRTRKKRLVLFFIQVYGPSGIICGIRMVFSVLVL